MNHESGSLAASTGTTSVMREKSQLKVLGVPVVIRFGQLGDLVLVSPAFSALCAQFGAPVTLVTSARYAPLASLFPGVGEVLALPDRSPLSTLMALAQRARQDHPSQVVDLHGSVRSRAFAALMGQPASRISKQSVQRRARLRFPRLPAPRTLTVRALQAAGVAPGDLASYSLPQLPITCLPPSASPAAFPALALCPGAGTATKRWPIPSWGGLARRWAEETGGRAAVFGAASERGLVEAVVEASSGTARAFPDPGLPATASALARASLVVAGDSGLLHLAGAVGTPVIGLFGPTGIDMGYWVWEDRGVALAVPELACRPCTLYGGARCPLLHHRCMTALTVERVWEAVESLVGRP